jgi:predicted small lipoprotein YifL
MKYALTFLLALALFVTAACGSEPPQPLPTSDDPAPRTQQQQPTGPEPTGPSRAGEFLNAYRDARAAWNAFREDRTPENYAIAGARILEAQVYGFEHVNNGHSEDTLRNRRELNLLRTDWQKSPPHGTDWEQHPEYKTARERFDEMQRS